MIEWTSFQEKPSLELIRDIQLNRDPNKQKISEAAFHAFCFRFEEPLKKIIERTCKNFGLSTEDAIEILDLTFKRFWQYPKFDPQKNSASNIDKGIIIYVSRIAQRTFIDVIKKRNGATESPFNGEEQIIYGFPEITNPTLLNDEKYAIIREILDKLSWKHKVIYLTYTAYEHDGYKLPRKLLSDLRDELGISQNTIRSYRFEVIRKIEEYTKLWQRLK